MNAGLRVVGQHDMPEMAATAIRLRCNYCDFYWETIISDQMMHSVSNEAQALELVSRQVDYAWTQHVLSGECHKKPDTISEIGKALGKPYSGALFGPDPAWKPSRPVSAPPEPKKEEKKRPERLIIIEE